MHGETHRAEHSTELTKAFACATGREGRVGQGRRPWEVGPTDLSNKDRLAALLERMPLVRNHKERRQRCRLPLPAAARTQQPCRTGRVVAGLDKRSRLGFRILCLSSRRREAIVDVKNRCSADRPSRPAVLP